jgi:hypothetical protein
LRCAGASVRGKASARFPPQWNDVVRDELVLVKKGKLTHASFPPRLNNIVQEMLVIVQDGNLAHARFPPWWNGGI